MEDQVQRIKEEVFEIEIISSQCVKEEIKRGKLFLLRQQLT